MPTRPANPNPLPSARPSTTEASQAQALKELQQAWDLAQKQLAELREAVQRHGELAELKAQGEVFARELDRAYRDLGEAVWSAAKKGRMELPAQVTAVAQAVKGVELVEQKQAARASAIGDLLAEGAELAQKLRAAAAPKKSDPATKPLASRGKKR